MTTLKITLTEDMLKLISRITFQELPNLEEEKKEAGWGLNFFNLYGGDLTFENIAMILGRYDEHIEGTECRLTGAQFPKDFEDYMWETHGYILEHIQDIEELVHQFCNRGGLTPGTYECVSHIRIWEKKN